MLSVQSEQAGQSETGEWDAVGILGDTDKTACRNPQPGRDTLYEAISTLLTVTVILLFFTFCLNNLMKHYNFMILTCQRNIWTEHTQCHSIYRIWPMKINQSNVIIFSLAFVLRFLRKWFYLFYGYVLNSLFTLH